MGIDARKIKAASPEHKPPAWPNADLGSIHFGLDDIIGGVNRINQRTFIKRTGQGLAGLAVAPAALAKPLGQAERSAQTTTKPVATFSIAGFDPHTGDRVDRGRLGAGLVARHVKIVDGHVEEQAARDRDVVQRRGPRIATGDAQDLWGADAARGRDTAYFSEVRIEAPVEADLQGHAGALYSAALMRLHGGCGQEGLDDVPVLVGGIIPEDDAENLRQEGVARVYTPKDFEMLRILSDMVDVAEEAA